MRERPLRTFFAVDLDADARARAVALSERLAAGVGGDGIRWVPAENLHVTLRFLGPTPREKVPELITCVGRETARHESFEARLGGLRALPSSRRPRVVALDVESRGRLEALSEAVERGVVGAGFDPEERPFRAHLTLGRARRGKPTRPWLAERDAALASFPVTSAVLYASELKRDGPVYTPLERLPLRSQLTRNSSRDEASIEEKDHGH